MPDRLKRPGKATIHLTVDPEVKAAVGKDISPLVNEYLRARFLNGIQGDIKKIDEEIEKLTLTVDQAKGRIELLKGQKEAMQIEKERIEQAEAKAELYKKYAKYVYLKQLLRGDGSLAGRQNAIRLAYGVLIRGEAATWALTQWKAYFSNSSGFDELRIPDGFLDKLGKWFNEASAFVSYVGGGKEEEKEFQEFIDVSNFSKSLCFKGHAYSALEKYCPYCSSSREYHYAKDYRLVFENGEFAGYLKSIKEKDAFVSWRKLPSEEKGKMLHGKSREETKKISEAGK